MRDVLDIPPGLSWVEKIQHLRVNYLHLPQRARMQLIGLSILVGVMVLLVVANLMVGMGSMSSNAASSLSI